jgi:hypothetical protein
MNLKSLPVVISLATMAAVPSFILPGKAVAFQLVSGTTSVDFDDEALNGVGLNQTGTANTVTPADGFRIGLQITPPPATTFSFDYDPNTNQLQPPFSGLIRHTGTITFAVTSNNGTTTDLTVGNFDIGYDATRVGGDLSGFFVRDTFTTNAVVFDLREPISDFEPTNLNTSISGELLVSAELAGVLQNPDFAGLGVGVASVNGTATSATAIPEPFTILGSLLGASFLIGARHRRFQFQRNRAGKQVN